MLKPALPPACYTEQVWFDRERQHIFGKLWLLAGLTQQLKRENSFVTRRLNGVPVVVQNVGDGKLRAFRNACAHRGMPIQLESCGNRKLICPYHGWTYGDDGGLRGIPNEKIYSIGNDERANARLQEFALEVVGNFVFVNLDRAPLPITKQYSADLLELLRCVSPYFAPEVSYTRFVGHYNWKLNFENVLDWNHAQFVHRQTLAPQLAFDDEGTFSAPIPAISKLFGPGSSLENARFSDGRFPGGDMDLRVVSHIGRSLMPYVPRWYSRLLEMTLDEGAFFACNIFPNVNFGSIHGEMFYLQQFCPVAPGRTEYHSWVFTSRLKPDVPAMPHLLWGMHHAEKRVVDEDILLLEALQAALESANSVGVMGDHESSLVAFGRWYMQNVA